MTEAGPQMWDLTRVMEGTEYQASWDTPTVSPPTYKVSPTGMHILPIALSSQVVSKGG
jgi:hypothetical protein